MKTILVFMALLTATPLFATDATKVLLMDAKESGPGSYTATQAVVGSMSIRADSIAFDRQADALQCHGTVTIRSEGSVVKTTDCVVQLSGRPTVYLLNPNGITLSLPLLTGDAARREAGALSSPAQIQNRILPARR